MPIKYSHYPINWKTEIRPEILNRAKNRCEKCGLNNYVIGYRDKEGHFYTWEYIETELEKHGNDLFYDVLANNIDSRGIAKRATKIILTIAHLDHDIENNEHSNLMALCQKCHLAMDQDQHRINSRKTINKKKGLQSLF